MTNEERIDLSEYGYDENKGIWSKAKEKFLEGYVNKKGYVRVTLKCIDGKQRIFYYHRAIWFLAYGPIPEGYQVNHIDENKQNNAISNLNLMTPKENINYGTGIQRSATKRRGVPNPKVAEALRGRKLSEEHIAKLRGIPRLYVVERDSKPVVAVDKDNNVVYEFASTQEAGRNGFTQSSVSKCCRGERRTHKGLRWYYKEDWEKLVWEKEQKRLHFKLT